ncbi:MAG: MATE family efflux transporter [Candidatus Hydrogenedentes bacterium]|nr:MATE family efflux transporter [Candidatus Hydrogenedentota bacterium]
MLFSFSKIDEPRGTGVREVLAMSGPIILGSVSYTAMEFSDRFMVSYLGTESLAAVGSASIWSWTLGVLIIGICGCVSTFVSQCYGKEQFDRCASYAWQGIYMSFLALALAVVLWPLSSLLFGLMGHTDEVRQLEISYFHMRLFGYLPLAAASALAPFFQAVNRPAIPMNVAIIVNAMNVVLNLFLIFGTERLGIPVYYLGDLALYVPQFGIAGAAIATSVSQLFQFLILFAVFLRPSFNAAFQTRAHWAFHPVRCRELIRIGIPAGLSMFVDVATWGIFISFVVGRFGAASLAANNIALSFMMVSFMPVVGLNQGIAPIVGQWIGRRDIPRAKARTYTAIKMAMAYMISMGLFMAVFGRYLMPFFSADPDVLRLGGQLLILAAIFQCFDAICIVCQGALRGAGDTRWLMFTTLVAAYCFFLPIASVMAFVLNGQALGAWIGAAIYIIALSGIMFARFQGERWRNINIFSAESLADMETIAGDVRPVPVACETARD